MRTALRAILIYFVGLVNVASTLLPIWPKRYLIITRIAPVQLALVAQHLTLFAGVAMLLLAYPVASGSRRSAYALMLCGAVAVFANLLKGFDIEEALIDLALVGTLWKARHMFRDIPLRYTIVDLARLGVALLGIQWVYALSGRMTLKGLHLLEDRATVWQANLPHAARAALMLTRHLRLETIFLHESQLALPGFLITLFVVISWTSLTRVAHDEAPADLYARLGRASHNSLTYLAHRSDVNTFLTADGRGAISYKLVGRVALQVGAILGPVSEREHVYEEFCAWLKREGLIPAAVAISGEELPAVLAAGMRALPIGREAVVDLTRFSVERLAKKMRWVERSLGKRGYRCELLSVTDITAPTRMALERIDTEWQAARGGQRYGCAMTLGRFPRTDDDACLISLMRDQDGQPVAYLTLLPGGENYYSLDLTRRSRSAPNAAMEFLMMETLKALRKRDVATVSLNFSTFSGLPRRFGGRTVGRLGSLAFQTDSLEIFNNKFLPEWAPRYLVMRGWRDLPDVIYAILVVEGADRVLSNAVIRGLRHAREALLKRLSPLADETQRLGGEGVQDTRPV